MKTQEDGFIEVSVNLYNKAPLIKWIRPVAIKKLKLLFDVYCMMIVSRESDLDFSDIDNMNVNEYMAWMVYGGYKSYQSTLNQRPKITIEDAVIWVKGIMDDDRLSIAETIKRSKEIGELAESYQKARNKNEGEEGEPKKGTGSVLQN